MLLGADGQKKSVRFKDSADFPQSGFKVLDEFEHAHRDDDIKKAIGIAGRLDRGAPELHI